MVALGVCILYAMRYEYAAAVGTLTVIFIYTVWSISVDNPIVLTQNQISHATQYDRYPSISSSVKALHSDYTPDYKILSFGSSSGQETKTLRDIYFPDAQLFGCDLVDERNVLKSALRRVPDATFFESTTDNIAHYGPYNIIFAMSVLCRHPWDGKYTFESFENTAKILDQNLKRGGTLVIYNGSYRFSDTSVYHKYHPESTKDCKGDECHCGFVAVHDMSGEPVMKEKRCIFTKW